MFATLLGPLPRPPLPDEAAPEALLEAVLAAQIEHGLEPLADAGWAPTVHPVAAWRDARDRAGGWMVKAVLPGPLSASRPAAEIRRDLHALLDAGCAWIEIHEPAATAIDDATGRERFAAVHRELLDGTAGIHRSLAITGGDAAALGAAAIAGAGYESLAVDLIAGPENWRLAVDWPGERGLITGALTTRSTPDDGPEVLLWAVGYGASTQGRGMERVGLAPAGSLAALSWSRAMERLTRLQEVVGLAALPEQERAKRIDPRAVDIRSAALGRFDPDAPGSRGQRPRDRPGP